MPLNLAAAIVATISLRDLHRIRGLYPGAIGSADAEDFQKALSARLSLALEDHNLQDIRDSLYHEMDLDGQSAEAALSILAATLVLRCPGVHIANADEEALRATMDQAIAECRNMVSEELKAIVDQLLEIKMLDCRIPEGDDPAFSDPRRSLQLLQAYWSLGRSLVLNQMSAPGGFQPHPLMRIVMNLQVRMEAHFGRLSDHEGSLDAFADAESLLNILVGGEVDDLSAVPEWTHERLRTVDSFLERVRLKIGSKRFLPTHEEKLFLEHAERAIEDYQKQANTAWERMLQNVAPRRDQPKGAPSRKEGAAPKQGQPDYCRVTTRGGAEDLSRSGYESLIKTRDRYGMFIDGMTREASCREADGRLRTATLTVGQLNILIEIIEAGKPMRPHATKTGNACASSEAASRLFEEARRKVDLKLGRYSYRAFRLHRAPGNSKLKQFEFAPPDDLQYCVIAPLGPRP